jgi:hypothetical protein
MRWRANHQLRYMTLLGNVRQRFGFSIVMLCEILIG